MPKHAVSHVPEPGKTRPKTVSGVVLRSSGRRYQLDLLKRRIHELKTELGKEVRAEYSNETATVPLIRLQFHPNPLSKIVWSAVDTLKAAEVVLTEPESQLPDLKDHAEKCEKACSALSRCTAPGAWSLPK